MPDLISILNSGESLEKTLVLTSLAFKHNPNFYSDYNKIRVFYYENLPRNEKGLGIHGTTKGLIENIREKKYLKYKSLDNLWEDRNHLLNKIYDQGRISVRIKEKLKLDRKHFEDIISQFPWYFIFEDFKEVLIKRLIGNYEDKIDLKFLDFKNNTKGILDKNKNLIWNSKVYLLNPNGSISQKDFWKDRQNSKTNWESLNKSIVVSPNVYMFLGGLYHFYAKEDNLLIGFRKFNKTRRISYDLGIKVLEGLNCIEEPRNVLFNNLLDKIDINYGKISSEKKTNLAIYGYVNNLL